MTVTVPVPPSTRRRCPVLIVLVPNAVPVTAGSPYSRHTIAAWLMIPPTSVTVAAILPNTGAQLGAVSGATRISPSWISAMPSADRITLAGPSAMPGEAAKPDRPPSESAPRCHCAMLSEVMPHSMIVNGSVITSGGTPSAGGGDHLRSASMIPLRRAISRGQYFGPRDGMPTAQPWYRSNSTSGTSCLLSRNMSSASVKNDAATSTFPRSRILRQMTECAQCST